MDRKLLKGLIAIVIILVANVGIFVLGSNFIATFWINYVFTMIAALLTAYIEIFFVRKEKLIFRYPISTVTYLYLGIELMVAVFAFNFLRHWVLVTFILQLCILAMYIVTLLSVLLHNTTTKEQQEIRSKDIVNFRYIADSMNGVISKMTYGDPNRKLLQHAYDSLLSGQVKSDRSVYDLEQQIITLIASLDQAVSNQQQEQIIASCKQIEAVAEERKRRLSQRLPF